MTVVVTLLVICSPSLFAGRRRAARSAEEFPPCSMVTGTGAVTFTRDEGRTLAPTSERLNGIGYTFGVIALDEKNTLLAWHRDDLLVSTNGGCAWRVATTIEGADFPPTLTAAGGGHAYAWSDNRRFLIRYDSRGAVKLKEPAVFVGLGVNPTNPDHVRAGSDDGTIWESRDGGETWNPIGILRLDSQPVIFYRIAFSPSDIDHIVAGTSASGGYVSRDGGRTWTRSALGSGNVNAFNFVFAPSDDRVVWAMAIDASGRHLFRSTDGGSTYVVVVDPTEEVVLRNQPVMAAHPPNANVLYFIFGTAFQGFGTNVYRYDAATRTVTMTHNDHDDIDSIAFSPSDPKVMYFGLEVESGVR